MHPEIYINMRLTKIKNTVNNIILYQWHTVKSILFIGHLILCISWVAQSTNVKDPNEMLI